MSLLCSQPTTVYTSEIKSISRVVDSYMQYVESDTTYKQMDAPCKIQYWCSKISENFNIYLNKLLPEFNEFSKACMLRWCVIGYAVAELTELYKTTVKPVRAESVTIREWLPYIIKQNLPPKLVPHSRYSQLRKYVRIWENRQIVAVLPALKGEYTHRVDEMDEWIRHFKEKVRVIAVQRDMQVPQSVQQQTQLYRVWLQHHSQLAIANENDDDKQECATLDAVERADIQGTQQSDDSAVSDDEEDMSLEELMAMDVQPVLSKEEQMIAKYRATIAELRAELRDTKKHLKQAQIKHCAAARERHVYRELHSSHKKEVAGMQQTIDGKNQDILRLHEHVTSLSEALAEYREWLKSLRDLYIQIYRKMNAGRELEPSLCGSVSTNASLLSERTHDHIGCTSDRADNASGAVDSRSRGNRKRKRPAAERDDGMSCASSLCFVYDEDGKGDSDDDFGSSGNNQLDCSRSGSDGTSKEKLNPIRDVSTATPHLHRKRSKYTAKSKFVQVWKRGNG